jgi:pilus assembly protein CpaB
VRWLVGCLVSVILVLAVAIVYIAQSSNLETQASVTQNAAQLPVPEIRPTVEILHASTRIEEGTRFEHYMFTPLPMDSDKVPVGSIKSQDLNSIVGKFARRLINAQMPILLDDVVEKPPVSNIQIPPGYRAVTITVDARSGVEGFAKPNSRVDVLWTYTQDGKKNVATITRFVKVLSVGGSTGGDAERANIKQGDTPVTMLVTEKDAKKIELARNLGQLSLSLVGEQETASRSGDPDTVTIQDLIGRPAETEQAEIASDGVMYTADPRTGRQLRYVLRNGRWSIDRSFGSE